MPSPGQIALFVFGTVVVIAGAYFTTYYIASRGAATQRGRIIRVHDRVSITRDNTICLIEAAGKFYLISMTGNNAVLLDSIDERRLEEASRAAQTSFTSSFSNAPQNGGLAERIREIIKKNRPVDSEEIEADAVPSVAQEEDGIDAVYRRIQNRRSQRSDGDKPDFESFLQRGDD